MKKTKNNSSNCRLLLIATSFIWLPGLLNAQNPPLPAKMADKPTCFHASGDSLNLQLLYLDNLFTKNRGELVDIRSGESFHFPGMVQSVVLNVELSTIIVRSSSYPRCVFIVQRKGIGAGAISYSGKIMSLACGDGYELQAAGTGGYKLIRRDADYFMAE